MEPSPNLEGINPENIRKVENFVRCLLQGLNALPEFDRISLIEQATALENLNQEFRLPDAATARSCDLSFWAKNDIE